jgi:hypothetical protein
MRALLEAQTALNRFVVQQVARTNRMSGVQAQQKQVQQKKLQSIYAEV